VNLLVTASRIKGPRPTTRNGPPPTAGSNSSAHEHSPNAATNSGETIIG